MITLIPITCRNTNIDTLLSICNEVADEIECFVAPVFDMPIHNYVLATFITIRAFSIGKNIARKTTVEFLIRLLNERQIKTVITEIIPKLARNDVYFVVLYSKHILPLETLNRIKTLIETSGCNLTEVPISKEYDHLLQALHVAINASNIPDTNIKRALIISITGCSFVSLE